MDTSGKMETTSSLASSSNPPATTTISTIAVQSGRARLVIALLQSGDWIQLKILEVEPELTLLGDTLAEAVELQKAHDEVLLQLQNKQSPVEELLRQADQLIATQRPRAEVYAAMADSLAKAWKDVNLHLEHRKQILDLNVQYHLRANECMERVAALEMACNDTIVPVEIDSVKRFLTNIHDIRRSVLEALMAALQQGNQLLAKLKELAAEGTLDSRPDRIKVPCKKAIAQVERWLEALHDRRKLLEISWQNRKTQLEQCLALALLANDLRELEEILNERRETLRNSDQLGDSSSSAELLLHENRKLHPEAKDLQERAIKITKATEQLVSSECFAGEPATAQAYTVLESSSYYLADLEMRDAILSRAIAFFRSAQTAQTKLDQLEIQLTTNELPPMSPQLAQLHGQAVEMLNEITEEPLREGHALLEATGRTKGTESVKHVVEDLENKKIFLESLCVAHKEENRRIYEALTNFMEKEAEIHRWLGGIAEAFLQGHQDMGSSLPMAEDFLGIHNQLLTDIQLKGTEINSLLLTLPPILEYLDDQQRTDVDKKVEALHERWVRLKNLLESRLDLAALYAKFYEQVNDLEAEMDILQELINNPPDRLSDNRISKMEEKWLAIKPLYSKLKATGQQFIEEAKKITDPYLDAKRASLCVETILERFASRQIVVANNWQSWQTELSVRRDVLVQLERTMTESTKTIDWVSKLESQLYPVITSASDAPPFHIVSDLEEKIDSVLPEIKKAQSDIEARIKATEQLTEKAQQLEPNPQTDAIKNKLVDLNFKLQRIIAEYEILLQMLIAFFKNIAELDRTIETLKKEYSNPNLPHDVIDVEILIKQHEVSKQTILEMLKFTQNESDGIISKINRQEPSEAAPHDIEKILYTLKQRRNDWETVWEKRRAILDQHYQLCQFDSDLHHIDNTLNDLSHQLEGIKGQYGKSLAEAKATSSTFISFEKTIDILEDRISNFVENSEKMLHEQNVHSPHVEKELKQLQERWNSFRDQVKMTRHLIDLSIEYFQLVEEADDWFREGSRLLVTIARKSTLVKHPEEATELLNEIETFLKPAEARQDERIKKISALAQKIFGPEKAHEVTQVVTDNKEMIDSFTVIRNELNRLSENLKNAENQKQKLLQEQEEADAKLAAAKAEAEAAQAAAAAAEEARRAAEAAAKILQDTTTFTQTVETLKIIHSEKQESAPETPKTEPPVFTVPLTDAVIQEGEKFKFECQVTGCPLPIVTWYKDGISIQNNLDYQTSFEQGVCSLSIDETFTEDSARFTCKAINAAGSAETSGFLSVKEAEPDEQLIAPSFVKSLEPGWAREGSSFQFECKVLGNPLPTVQWFKNNDCIDNSPDYITTYNNGEAILKFEEVFLEDKANYVCKAENQLGSIVSEANLHVEPLEPTESPSFPLQLSNVMARAGQKIKLECQVDGIPKPSVVWSHNGRVVKESHDLKLQYDDDNNKTKTTLVISEAFPKDAGVYVVTASNIAGEAISTCNVTVKGRLPTETSDSEIASDMEPIKPSIQEHLKDVSTFEGKRVRLDCIIIGQPEPEVIWYHDERPVKESTDFQLLFQGDRCSLIIKEAFMEDAGEYKVVAINSAGEASSKCNLSVTNLTETPSATRDTQERLIPSGSPPTFTKLLTDILVSEGDAVTFTCCVSGDPKPQIKWLLNNQEIIKTNHLSFSEDDDGCVTLHIDNVTPDDRGVYTVKASNSSGDAKCFAQLIVKSLRGIEDKFSPPNFTEIFHDQTIPEKQPTRFECVVRGKPVPKVKWLFNDVPVYGPNFVISQSGNRHILSIPSVSSETQGKISCIAENENGQSTCVAQLNVSSTALAPFDKINESSMSSSSVSIQRQVITKTSTSNTFISSTGQEPVVEMHSFTTESKGAMRQFGDAPAEVIQAHSTEEYHKTGAELPVHHKETVISIEKGAPVEVKKIEYKSTRKITPPRFVSPIIGKIVDQGSDVVLEGILDGYPSPEVTWTKNGTELIPNEDSLSISWSLNKTRVELKNVSVKDAGRYTCTAVNEAGTASSTADIVVKKTTFPPVFGRRLQAQLVKKGERVVMEVEVTGTPEPSITWFKDGNQITGKESENIRLKHQGNCHSIVIEQATLGDSGKYMVRAVNSGGEAQSIADFAVFEPTPDTMVEVVKTLVFEDVQQVEKLQKVAGTEIKPEHLIPIEIEKQIPSEPKTIPPTETITTTTIDETSQKTVIHKIEKSVEQVHEASVQSVEHPIQQEEIHEEHSIIHEIPVEPEKAEAAVEKVEEKHESPIVSEKPEVFLSPIVVEKPILHKPPVEVEEIESETEESEITRQMIKKPILLNIQQPVAPTAQRQEENIEPQNGISNGKSHHVDVIQVPEEHIISITPEQSETLEIPITHETTEAVPTEVDIPSENVTREITQVFVHDGPKIIESHNEHGKISSDQASLTSTLVEQKVKEEVSFIIKKHYADDRKEETTPLKPLFGETAETVEDKPAEELVKEPHIETMPVQEEKKPELPEEEQSTIDSSSITKESAYEYFKSKIEIAERERELPELVQQSYAKFESMQQPKVAAREEVHEEICKEVIIPHPPPMSPTNIPKLEDLASKFLITPQPAYQQHHEFNLVPEPPPEIGYMPKVEIKKSKDEFAGKIKQLEQIHRELPPTQVPQGGVKIFPTAQVAHENFASAPEEFPHQGPVYRPQASIETRPLSPRPSAEALEMEKLWTPHRTSSPDPMYSSSEYYAMEKQYSELKTPEFDRPGSSLTSDYSTRPLSALSSSTDRPSADGVAMDRLWAHKHPSSNLTKTWPPPEHESEKIVPPWQAQGTVEKQWQPLQQSQRIETTSKTESFSSFNESKSFTQVSYPPLQPQPSPIQHYTSETIVSHLANVPITSSTSSRIESYQNEEQTVIEEKNIKPSEAKKIWPPQPVENYDLKAPSIVKKVEPTYMEKMAPRPVSVQDITNEVYLEPGPPPEIGFAQPPRERRLSYVETIEQDLERNLEKVPSRVLPGSVRTIPPPPQKEHSVPPPLPPRYETEPGPPLPAKTYKPEEYQRFPDLEPFPYKPDNYKPKSSVAPPPPTPSKFTKGNFIESDFECDYGSIKIKPNWKPRGTSTDGFRHVNAPTSHTLPRSRSTEPEPLPPSKFENPSQLNGPSSRPFSSLESSKKYLRENMTSSTSYSKSQSQSKPIVQPKPRYVSQPVIKPGSPPEFLQAKLKPKPESGYMADTDEPRNHYQKTIRTEEMSQTEYHRQYSEKMYDQNSQQWVSITSSVPKMQTLPRSHKFDQQKSEKKFSSSTLTSKKEISTPTLVKHYVTSTHGEDRDSSLEPFPFKPDPPRPKRARCPPPPSPSKFVKGEFRESDFESDYDGRIPPVWTPTATETNGYSYRPIHPILTPTGGRQSYLSTGTRSPTPPTEFDNPPKIIGPPRPKFEPIEKPKQTVKLDEILKTSHKTQTVFKPKPVNAKSNKIIDVIIASPGIKPGSPPELGYAPPSKQTRYYKSTTSAPYHNATQTETSNVVQLNESTENSHRVVNIHQTTKVIKFGDQRKEESKLEPFPFKPDPVNYVRRSSAPPPAKPKKFIPGEFRESDYDSEVDGARIKPKWVPYESDNDEPHYRRVHAPAFVRSSSVPAHTPRRVLTPMEFDTHPPEMPSKISMEIEKQVNKNAAQMKLGSPPEYAFVPAKAATKIATKHMNAMSDTFKSKAQQFVNDVMVDVKKTKKPILKSSASESDAQVYREESRVAQHGTKHIDPDTGLIYFKYDFGYEFGVVLPGAGKTPGEIPQPQKTIIAPPKRSADIELPVLHETTKPQQHHTPVNGTTGKNVKWEPTSESDISEWESNQKKKTLPTYISIPTTPSPMSLSPSLPSMSPAYNHYTHPGSQGMESPSTTPSTPGRTTPGHQRQSDQPEKPPSFITPLRDIAVLNGHTARFECIAQAEPQPNIIWSKNGRILANCHDYNVQFRNGVCRLTIPKAFPGDAGIYNCTATNHLGTVSTSATLQVSGERRSSYI